MMTPAEQKHRGALPVRVSQTEPPSLYVKVLGHELFVGPAHATDPKVVLVCFGRGGVHAVPGVPQRSGTPVRPALLEGLSPVAEVLLRGSQVTVMNCDITLLRPDGTEWLL